MKTKLIALLLLAFIGKTSYAQTLSGRTLDYQLGEKAEKEKPQGSQYLNDAFLPGNYSDGALILYRYNAYADEIEFKNSEGITQYVVRKKGATITSQDKETVYEFNDYANEKNEQKSGYLNRIAVAGNIKIYQLNRIYLQAEAPASSGYSSAKPAMFKKASAEYYIKVKDNPIVFMPAKKKDFFKLFPSREKEVADFIKANKTDLQDKQDLKALAAFLDTL
ncbi:MAG TPA: hypothetical protein VFR70_06130 [Flavobacterium sp.]|nr:hypothetical protein [Flavobacterium sp.]